jgi:hypothetical protein
MTTTHEDMKDLAFEQLMELAGRPCSCVRNLKTRGVEDPECEGTCTHARALRELGRRGLVT